MHLISIRLCVYIASKCISSESKHRPSDKKHSAEQLNFPSGIP